MIASVLRRPRSALLLVVALLAWSTAKADHFPGGSITYRCVGNNLYEVTLTLWRSCSGVAMVPQSIRLHNDCGLNFTRTGLLPRDSMEVSPVCPSALNTTTCHGGTLRGTMVYHYVDTVYLSPCNTWTIRWDVCCREASVNVLLQPGLYIEARLNNGPGFSCESSSTFTNDVLPHVCVGQPVTFDPGAVDPTAVRRRFSLIDARFASPSPFPVGYVFPYYGAEPFTGMQIDTASGVITFTPTIQGNVVTVVQVDEYNAAGQWIGSVMRDFAFVVQACSNQQPDAASGAVTAVNGGVQAVDDRTLRLCASGPYCFSATITDPDAGQSLTLTTAAGDVLPGAEVSVSGTSPATITICGDGEALSPGDRWFTITAMDDGCPLRTFRSFTYHVEVMAPPDAGMGGTAVTCPQENIFFLGDSLGGDNPPDGAWAGPAGSSNGWFHPGTDPEGAYGYYTTAFPGCHDTAHVVVTYLPADLEQCIDAGLADRAARSLRVFPNPAQRGVIVEVTDGALIAHVLLMDGQGRVVLRMPIPPASRAMLQLPAGLASGGYVLHALDVYGSPIARTPLVVLP
jgi:hypothetical protein